MKDKDGFTIRCKNCEWRMINDEGDKDFVCSKFGTGLYKAHMCYADEHCRYYEPDVNVKEGELKTNENS